MRSSSGHRSPGFVVIACLASLVLTEILSSAARRPFSFWDRQADELLAKMTLEEKVGQMLQPDQANLKDIGDIRKYNLGSLLSGGDSDPKGGNSMQEWTAMYERYQAEAVKSRLGIPLLYGVDAVHGHSNVLGAVIFPHNVGLGATRNVSLVEEVGRITALEMRATGIHWTFAPCVTVPRDERWGRTYEGFGEAPELARDLGAAATRGLQGTDLADPLSVLACAKHFVGDGGTVYGTGPLRRGNSGGKWPLDRGDCRLDEKTLKAVHMQGYISSIKAGVGTIMPSYSSWNGVKCSGDRKLLTDILKGELGFEGFLISDYNAIDELPGDYRSQITQSVLAGMDMFMVPDKYVRFYNDLLSLVNEGKVPISRIDDAVRRILRVKFAMGLMDRKAVLKGNPELQKKFGTAEHRRVAQDAVRQSLVLLKNDGKTLPLSKTAARIHVSGRAADDIGIQCGGWTIKWQGQGGPVTTGGTTILKAIQQTVSAETKITTSRDGSGAEGATVAVAVIGELPYAEMFGDRSDLSLAQEDIQTVTNLKKARAPVVVVLISGRPMIIESVLPQATAFLAAWLPGTEGQGVADVLFGNYKPSGKLPFSWPRSNNQLPINVGDSPYDPLFKYGFGMSY